MKILVIRFSHLGDVVLTLPAITALRKKFPEAQIDFLTKEAYSDILSCHAGIDSIIVEEEALFHKGSFKIFKLKKIIADDYDLLIDFSASFKSRMLISSLPRTKVLRYRKGAVNRRLLLAARVKIGEFPHVIDRYLAALAPLGIEAGGTDFRLEIPHASELAAEHFLAEVGVEENFMLVGLSPTAIWPTKRWPTEYYVELARLLIKLKQASVLFFGAPAEFAEIEEMVKSTGTGAFNAAGRPSLTDTIALIAKCRVFVSNDSGLMHLAAAASVPTAAFFGPTIKEFGFYPRGRHDTILEKNLSCRPCSLHGSLHCPLDHHSCLREITPTEALQAVEQIISAITPPDKFSKKLR